MSTIHRFFVTAASGLVEPTARELERLGAGSTRLEPAGVRVRGPLSFGYTICLWSRCAHRVLLGLADPVVDGPDALYEAVAELPWEEHLPPGRTFAVDFTGRGPGIRHEGFGAQRVKDAVVDRLRARRGSRPDVDKERPDLQINVFLRGRGCSISIDLSGESLHRRGYRGRTGEAPLRETLAAGMLLHADWDSMARQGADFVDPMCGSGTLPIEAAWIALDRAPGLDRERWGFEGWGQHESQVWSEVLAEARRRAEAGARAWRGRILGFDRHARVLDTARQAAARAGVEEHVGFEVGSLASCAPPTGSTFGLVATNPPHGERMGDKTEAREGYAELGRVLRSKFEGYKAAILVPDDGLRAALGLPVEASIAVRNGPIDCRIILAPVRTEAVEAPTGDFANRLRKNLKRLGKWAKRNGVTCYRVYDADIPEYAAAIDLYGDHVHIQEYEAPKDVPEDVAASRLGEILADAPAVLGVPGEHVFLKQRRRQRGKAQYERQGKEGHVIEVQEGGLRFLVNLSDYLDTGLFLDHRLTRARIYELAKGRRFLNLFAYTGTATVHAAAGGAKSTTTVDLSNTYLDWAERNLVLNGMADSRQELVRADVLAWLEQTQGRWDLIFVDPPTFSNSKAMSQTWDVQRDHARLLDLVMARLSPEGIAIFSTNARKFRLDAGLSQRYDVVDVTTKTIPEDFRRRPNIHRCYELKHRR